MNLVNSDITTLGFPIFKIYFIYRRTGCFQPYRFVFLSGIAKLLKYQRTKIFHFIASYLPKSSDPSFPYHTVLVLSVLELFFFTMGST